MDILTELKQVLVKEQINEVELSHLQLDFYKKINKHRMKIQPSERKEIDLLLRRIRDKRIGKLIMLIDFDDMRKIKEKLTDEECEFWEKITDAQKSLKKRIMWELVEVD